MNHGSTGTFVLLVAVAAVAQFEQAVGGVAEAEEKVEAAFGKEGGEESLLV